MASPPYTLPPPLSRTSPSLFSTLVRLRRASSSFAVYCWKARLSRLAASASSPAYSLPARFLSHLNVAWPLYFSWSRSRAACSLAFLNSLSASFFVCSSVAVASLIHRSSLSCSSAKWVFTSSVIVTHEDCDLCKVSAVFDRRRRLVSVWVSWNGKIPPPS